MRRTRAKTRPYESHIEDADDNPRVLGSTRFRAIHGIPAGLFTIGELAIQTGATEKKIRYLHATRRILPTATSAKRDWLLFDRVAIETIRESLKPLPNFLPEMTRVDPTTPEKDPKALKKSKVKPYEPKTFRTLRASTLRAEIGGPKVAYGKEDCVRCFRLLEAGKSLVQIVLETELHAAVVSSINDDYANMKAAIVVPKAALDVINKLPLDGTFPVRDATHLLEILESAVADLACEQCVKRKRAVCTGCARDQVRAALRRCAPPANPQSTEGSEQESPESLSAAG